MMEKYSLTVPDYLKDSLAMAETKLNGFSDSVTKDPLPVPSEPNERNVGASRSKSKFLPNEMVKDGHMHATKQEVNNSVVVKSDIRNSGPAQQMANIKIPRKSSAGNNIPLKVVKAEQTPKESSAAKTQPPKFNVTALLGMKGIHKADIKEAKVAKTAFVTNSFLPNLAKNNDQKPPPPHQWNNSNQSHSWEDKNMCGWGDVQEITKELLTVVKTFPTVAEAINFNPKDYEQR